MAMCCEVMTRDISNWVANHFLRSLRVLNVLIDETENSELERKMVGMLHSL